MRTGQLRDMTNPKVLMLANIEINKYENRSKGNDFFKKLKLIKPLSSYYQQKRLESIIEIINIDKDDPRKAITVGSFGLALNEYSKKKAGKPDARGQTGNFDFISSARRRHPR